MSGEVRRLVSGQSRFLLEIGGIQEAAGADDRRRQRSARGARLPDQATATEQKVPRKGQPRGQKHLLYYRQKPDACGDVGKRRFQPLLDWLQLLYKSLTPGFSGVPM